MREDALLLHNGIVPTPDGSVVSSLMLWHGRIDAYGVHADDHDGSSLDLDGSVVRPGYIDLHCHGGGGASLYTGDADDITVAARAHLTHGTTALLASMTAASTSTLCRAAEAVHEAVSSGRAPNLAGIHFEGPFLSTRRPGAQPADALRGVDEREIERLIIACGGLPMTMTIAPELPGAVAAIGRFRDHVKFFVGHTDASSSEFEAAVDAGAHAVTHLFNAMPPLHHRHTGPIAAALLDPRVRSELILDGHHLNDDVVRLALAVAGPKRLMLVTDAMAAAGVTDGEYSLPGLSATVRGGAAYVSGTTTLAGSTLTMDRAVGRLIDTAALTDHDVNRMASTNAADAMGWTDRGSLRIGARADLVVTDRAGALKSVFLAGDEVVDGAD